MTFSLPISIIAYNYDTKYDIILIFRRPSVFRAAWNELLLLHASLMRFRIYCGHIVETRIQNKYFGFVSKRVLIEKTKSLPIRLLVIIYYYWYIIHVGTATGEEGFCVTTARPESLPKITTVLYKLLWVNLYR